MPESEQIDGGNAGDTFTLTTGTDTFTGTAKDDTFAAGEVNGNKTLTAGDDLDGGAGTDTLKVSTSGGADYSGFTAKNIEVLDATADDGAQTFDLSGTDSLTTLRSTNSNADVTFNHVATLANVEATKLTEDDGANKPNITVQYENDTVSGSEDAVSFTLNSSNVGTVKLGSVSDDNGGIESLALTANGGNSTVDQLDSDITTLTFTGDKNVTIDAALNTSVKTIDASAATGGLSVEVAGNNVTFTGGSGDDEIDFGDTLNASDAVTGGDGTDRLIAEKTGLISAAANVSGMEIIRVDDASGLSGNVEGNSDTLNAGAFADATIFELTNGVNGAARIDDLTANQTRVDILSDTDGGVLTLDEASTEFTIGIGTTGTDVANTASVVFANDKVTTANIVSSGPTSDGIVNTLALDSDLLNTVNISGEGNLNLTTTGGKVTTVAGGDATGDLDVTQVNLSTKGATITTGSGNDTVAGGAGDDTITTGAGNDTIQGSTGSDTITLGGGTNTIVYKSLEQSDSENIDTIVGFVDGKDIINVRGLLAETYVGTKSSFDLAQGALAGNGTVSAVFDASTGRFWVDMNGDGTLDSNDFRVTLSNVTNLSEASVLADSGAVTVKAGINNTGTAGIDDMFIGDFETLSEEDTKVTGDAGDEDTLRVTDQVTDDMDFTAGPPVLTNISKIILAGGTNTGANKSVTVHDEEGVAVVAGAAALVKLGEAEGQSFAGSSKADVVTINAVSQSAEMGAGNDFIIVNGDFLDGATLAGGDGTDALILDAATTDISSTSAELSGIEVLQIAGNIKMTTEQYADFSGGVNNDGKAATITFTDGGTVDVIQPTASALGDANITADPAVKFVFSNNATTLNIGDVAEDFEVTGGTKADAVSIDSTAWTDDDTFDGKGGTDTFTVNVSEDMAAAVVAGLTDVENFVATGEGQLKVTFADTNTELTSIDLSGLSGGSEVDMGDLDTAEVTVNARNSGADAITTTSADNTETIVYAGADDTVTLGAKNTLTHTTAIYFANNDNTGTIANLNINLGGFDTGESIRISLLESDGATKIGLKGMVADGGDFPATGDVWASFTLNAAGNGGQIVIDAKADGAVVGTEDMTINLSGVGMNNADEDELDIVTVGIDDGDLVISLTATDA